MTEQTAPGPKLQLQERVRLAFEAVRRNDLAGVTELQTAGDSVVPLLTDYLQDNDIAVRREAVSLLNCVAGQISLPSLMAALKDTAPEIRERAARAIYQKYDVASLLAEKDLEARLLSATSQPEPPAAAVLLLAYFPSEVSSAALLRLRDSQDESMVKFYEWSTPVELQLVAKVALARHGDLDAQRALIEAIQAASASEGEFLLQALREIDSSLLLRELSRLLVDTRQATTLVHSAPNLRPRLCDLAVNAFVKRLELTVTFELSEFRHYEQSERDEVQRLVEQALPRVPLTEGPS